jgi:hypothetical protein
MRKKSGGEVHAQSAEKEPAAEGISISCYRNKCNSRIIYAQEWDVREVLQRRGKDIALSKTVFEDSEGDVTGTRKNDGASKKNLEAVHEETVDVECPPEKQVVEDGQECGGGKTVVREHVGHHADLVMHRCA